MRPSWAEAATAVLRLEESAACTANAVVEAGTTMVAVTITLATATVRTTGETGVPAMVASFPRTEELIDPSLPCRCCCQLRHAHSPRLPLALQRRATHSSRPALA